LPYPRSRIASVTACPWSTAMHRRALRSPAPGEAHVRTP
jgi:hypothetical protein